MTNAELQAAIDATNEALMRWENHSELSAHLRNLLAIQLLRASADVIEEA